MRPAGQPRCDSRDVGAAAALPAAAVRWRRERAPGPLPSRPAHVLLCGLALALGAGLAGCVSPPAAPVPSAAVALPRGAIATADPRLQAALEALSAAGGDAGPRASAEGQRATATVSYSVELTRHLHPLVCANALTVPLGYFFHYYRVRATSRVEVTVAWPPGGQETLSATREESYPHPGYLPPPRADDGTPRPALFYEDVRERELQHLAALGAAELARWWQARPPPGP